MILVKSDVDRFARPEPIASNAALFGAKIVAFRRPFAVSRRFEAFSAPYSDVKPASRSVDDTLVGRANTWSMTWMMPPVKLMF
jgi:hypothetical protein